MQITPMRFCLVISLCFTTILHTFGQLKPSKLSVFSNGVFYEQKDGTLKFNNNIAAIDLPGTILTGTYWLAAENNSKIKQVDVGIDTLKKVKQSQFVDDFLVGNVGKKMTLRFTQKQLSNTAPLRTITGTLLAFNSNTGLVKFKTTDSKILLINADNLNDIELDAGANETFEVDTLVRRAKIMLEKPATEMGMHQVSMQTGLQWQPSYFVKLGSNNEARIVMKATVENGTGVDYNAVDLDLVVGKPQLYFGKDIDPVADFYLPAAFDQYTYGWDYGEAGGKRRADRWAYNRIVADSTSVTQLNGLFNTRVPQTKVKGKLFETIFGSGRNKESEDDIINLTEFGNVALLDITGDKDYSALGNKSADLYYYHAGKVWLPKDAKTLLPISQSTITYKHVYEAAIGDITNYVNTKAILLDEPKAIDVFHSIKLTNKTNAPLTEAPIFIVNENEDPIAQDMVAYTPINEDASIKLAKAIDISVKNKEDELSKEEKAKKAGRKNYDKVTLKGTLDVVNYLDKDITLTVKKALRGEVTKPDNGIVTKPGRFIAVNPISLIKWEIELKPGEKKTLVYEYEVYIAP